VRHEVLKKFLPHRSKLISHAYFSRSRRFTKSRLAFATTPSLAKCRFRFLDFLVRMCRLNDFWWVIFPVPVTLKRFLALEFVLTFGILKMQFDETLAAFRTGGSLGSRFRQFRFCKRCAKVGYLAENSEIGNKEIC
jgi:hypothetical protein